MQGDVCEERGGEGRQGFGELRVAGGGRTGVGGGASPRSCRRSQDGGWYRGDLGVVCASVCVLSSVSYRRLSSSFSWNRSLKRLRALRHPELWELHQQLARALQGNVNVLVALFDACDDRTDPSTRR